MNINYLLCFEQESNDPVNVEDVHQPVEDYDSTPGNEFISMILFCIDSCRWWTKILNLHNSTAEHVDAGNAKQVELVQDNDEHANVTMPGKNTPL